MTDFAKLVGSKGPVNDKLEAFEFIVPKIEAVVVDEETGEPKGTEMIQPMNGNGEPLALMLHPGGGTRFKKAMRIMAIKMRKARGQNANEEDDDDIEMTDAEAEAELEKTDESAAEILARCTDGWNLYSGGKPMKYSMDKGKEFYLQVPQIREAVDEAATKAGKKTKAKKTA